MQYPSFKQINLFLSLGFKFFRLFTVVIVIITGSCNKHILLSFVFFAVVALINCAKCYHTSVDRGVSSYMP